MAAIAVEKNLGRLRPDRKAVSPVPPETGAETLASWLDARRGLILRLMLDSPESGTRLPGCPETLSRVLTHCETLRRDARAAFSGFREKWEARLDPAALTLFLDRNGWLAPHPKGGYALPGKGARKDARTLYLQTLHDMASDCARQWASLGGRVQALQTGFAASWREEAALGRAELFPAWEEAFRAGESDAWKSLRLSLGTLAEESFLRGLGRWDAHRQATREALARSLSSAWMELDPRGNGWAGFMRALSGLAEGLAVAMIDHYESKWELFLGGSSPSDGHGPEG